MWSQGTNFSERFLSYRNCLQFWTQRFVCLLFSKVSMSWRHFSSFQKRECIESIFVRNICVRRELETAYWRWGRWGRALKRATGEPELAELDLRQIGSDTFHAFPEICLLSISWNFANIFVINWWSSKPILTFKMFPIKDIKIISKKIFELIAMLRYQMFFSSLNL